MAETGPGGDAQPGHFVDVSLRGARFVRADLSGAVMRGVDIAGAEIDSPWLLEGGGTLLVNGVDVVPLVRAELARRFPGRAGAGAVDAAGLQQAWAVLAQAWSVALARAERLPEGAVDVSVDGEWSFAQTLRHLVMATDTWLGRAVLELEQPYHPLGLPNEEFAADGHDMGVFPAAAAGTTPPYAEVLAARAERVAMVRAHLAGLDADALAVPRRNPWAPEYQETTLSCLQTILGEEWEHLRYAIRDLEVLETRVTEGQGLHGSG